MASGTSMSMSTSNSVSTLAEVGDDAMVGAGTGATEEARTGTGAMTMGATTGVGGAGETA